MPRNKWVIFQAKICKMKVEVDVRGKLDEQGLASRLAGSGLPYNNRIELTARGLSRRLLGQPPRQVPSRRVRAGLAFRPCSQLIRALYGLSAGSRFRGAFNDSEAIK